MDASQSQSQNENESERTFRIVHARAIICLQCARPITVGTPPRSIFLDQDLDKGKPAPASLSLSILSGLRCQVCGGQPIVGDALPDQRIYTEAPEWQSLRPHKGRPTKALVELRRQLGAAAAAIVP